MSYWLFQWFDDQYIQTIEDAERVLSYPIAVEDLQQQALSISQQKPIAQASNGIPILAGRGLDLSHQEDCIAALCSTCQVDHLFKHIWHYFDRIIIQDSVADHFSVHRECWKKSDKKH